MTRVNFKKIPTSATVAIVFTLLTVSSAWSSCFTIYNAKNDVLYQSTETPIDLSQSISRQIAARYPKHHLVMVDRSDLCAEVRPIEKSSEDQGRTGASEKTFMDSPLFRNAAAARVATNAYEKSYGDSFVMRDGERASGAEMNVNSYNRSGGTAVSGYTRAVSSRGR